MGQRKLWSDFSAGIRPRWEWGRIDQQAYQLGFETLDNVIIEGGAARKRQGIVNSGLKDDGTAITSHDGLPFANGIGALAWQTGFLYYLISFYNQTGSPVRQDLSLAFTVGQFFHTLGKVASFFDSAGVKRSVILNEDTTKTYSTTEFGLIVEAGGRRFFFNSPQTNPGFTLISFIAGVLVVSVTLESYIPPGRQIFQQTDTGPGTYYVSLNYDPNTAWPAFCPSAWGGGVWGVAMTHTVIWWWRNGVYYTVATPGIGTTSTLISAGDSQGQHTVSAITVSEQAISVRGSRSAPLYSMQLTADLIAGNTLTTTINGDATPPATAFSTTHIAAMIAHTAALNADATLLAAGISATYPGTGRVITFFGPVTSGTFVVTGGASQATAPNAVIDQLQNFTYADGTGATLVATDPIIFTIKGYGFIRWACWGNGLWIGTSRGVYEIVSGLGPGFSPQSGGFFAQEVSNVGALEIKHAKSLTQNQGHTVTKTCVVFVSDVDEVSVLNRYTKQVQSIHLDLPDTHAIDSMAPLGGHKVAILCAEITARSLWSTTTGYNSTNNFLYILDEIDGSYSKFPIPAISIFGLDAKGLLLKQVVSGVVQVGMIPWRSFLKYQGSPFQATPVYLDTTLTASIPFTARIVTLPVHLSRDLGDQKTGNLLTLRVKETASLSMGYKGKTLRPWDSSLPPANMALNSLYSGETGDLSFMVDASAKDRVQVQVEDSSQYNFEILAMQADFSENPDGQTP